MVDGFPYKEEVGGSNPSVPTSLKSEISDQFQRFVNLRIPDLRFEIENSSGYAES